MKLTALLILLLLTTVAMVPVARAQVPELTEAKVTLPWTEVRQLLDLVEKAREAEEKPPLPPPSPVPHVLRSARYDLDLSGDAAVFQVDYDVRTLAPGWHAVPLVGGALRLSSVTTGSEEASVVWQDGRYVLLAQGAGEFFIRAELVLPPPAQWPAQEGVSFIPAPATLGELTVNSVPGGFAMRLGEVAPVRDDREEGVAVFHLPGDGQELHLRLEREVEETVEPATESAWSLHSQMLARYVDGRLRFNAQVQAHADNGSGLTAVLRLPGNASRVTVEGEDLTDWKLASRKNGHRALHLGWKTRDRLDRTFLLGWEVPQSPLAESWTVAWPAIVNEEGGQPSEVSRHLVALVPPEGLELRHASLQSAMEARKLPLWLRQQVGGDDYLVAEAAGEAALALVAAWLPRVETAQATVSLAKFETRLVPDGSMLVMADYTIQHHGPIDWRLQLPAADQILTCEVNQQAAKPIQRGENEIGFRLPATASETVVHLCYAARNEALDPVSGRVALELPQTDLFIHHLDWELTIPDRYEPTAIEGNVELNTGTKSSGNLISLKKELCRGERPAVEIFYQRKGLTSDL